MSDGVVQESVGLNRKGQTQEAYELLRILMIDDDCLNQLYQVFDEIDEDGSGEVSLEEFHAFFELISTRFSKRIFGLMDKDSSGEIDFHEFVIATWNYCTFTHRGLAEFSFDIYDLDSSGTLEAYELEQLTKDVYGEKDLPERTQRTIQILAPKGENNLVTRAQFANFNQKQPLLLFPAYQMQETLIQKIMGKNWWGKMSQERERNFKSRSVFDILHGIDPEMEGALEEPELEHKKTCIRAHCAVSVITGDAL